MQGRLQIIGACVECLCNIKLAASGPTRAFCSFNSVLKCAGNFSVQRPLPDVKLAFLPPSSSSPELLCEENPPHGILTIAGIFASNPVLPSSGMENSKRNTLFAPSNPSDHRSANEGFVAIHIKTYGIPQLQVSQIHNLRQCTPVPA